MSTSSTFAGPISISRSGHLSDNRDDLQSRVAYGALKGTSLELYDSSYSYVHFSPPEPVATIGLTDVSSVRPGEVGHGSWEIVLEKARSAAHILCDARENAGTSSSVHRVGQPEASDDTKRVNRRRSLLGGSAPSESIVGLSVWSILPPSPVGERYPSLTKC